MTRRPPANIHDLLELLIRRKKWIILCLIIVPPLAYVGGHYWPKTYRSDAKIMVDQQRVSDQYVKSTVQGDLADRLLTIQDEVMSRTSLLAVANQNHLYQEVREKDGDERALAKFRADLTVETIRGATERNPITGFKISYIASSPELAQQVTRQIADLFIEKNMQQRNLDAEGTEQFISAQLAQSRAQLATQDEKIRAFKAAHLGELPEQETANLAMIGEYQSLAQQNSDAIDRANQQKVYLQSMLNVSGGQKLPASAPPPTPLQLQLQVAETKLASDRQQYTDAYPDIVRLQDQIASLKAEIKHQPPTSVHAVASSSVPTMEKQLESQLKATQEEIQSRVERQKQIEGKIGSLQSQVQNLPAVQQQYESLSRDYTEMQKNYNSLLEKSQSSGMAAQLELHSDSEHLHIQDAANLPMTPYSPNLHLVYAGGLAGALILGLGLAFLVEMRDPSIHNADEAEIYLSVPLIAALPRLQVQKAIAIGARRT
jgi:polysaccharide chain length determinant protein (PEP-CTERM system associated)